MESNEIYFHNIKIKKQMLLLAGALCAPGEYRFRHHLVDRQSPIVVDSHKIEY